MDYEDLTKELRRADRYCLNDYSRMAGDAAAALTALLAENARLKKYEDKCHDCPIVCAKTEIIKAHEGLEAVQAELEQKSKLIAQQAAELERRDKLLKEQETELDQMKREKEANYCYGY